MYGQGYSDCLFFAHDVVNVDILPIYYRSATFAYVYDKVYASG